MNKFSTLPNKHLFPYLFDSVVFVQVILNFLSKLSDKKSVKIPLSVALILDSLIYSKEKHLILNEILLFAMDNTFVY